MSRHNSKQRDGVTLPFALRKELGLPDASSNHDARRRNGRGGGNRVADRKQQRHMSRVEKRGSGFRQQDRRGGFRQSSRSDLGDEDAFESDVDEDEMDEQQPEPVVQAKAKNTKRATPTTKISSSPPPPKSILKKKKVQTLVHDELHSASESDQDRPRASSPAFTLNASSKAFKDRAAQDDAEINALEKRLGMKKKKSSKLGDEMLDYLLEGLDDEGDGKKRKREEKDWLDSKRRKTGVAEDSEEVSDSDGLDGLDGFEDEDISDEDMDEGEEIDPEEYIVELDSDDTEGQEEEHASEGSQDDEENSGGDFGGFHSDDQVEQSAPAKVRENPYVAPVVPGANTTKYIPPSLRKRDQDGDESLQRLKRQVQGQLNKLSEANMISILGEIERLYRTNPRQDVTTALIDLLLSTFNNLSSLQNTFIILHAAFIAAVYKVMGTDFGAELLCKIVEQFDEKYKSASVSKEALNLISLLANLFTFGVVSSNIIYDHIRILLSDFSELNAELLLRIVRDCGPQLRSDDPSALKGIVQMMHDISTDLTNKGQQLNIRTRVMMDTITDLKNNKMKNATNAAGITGEHITRMRKALGSLNSRSLKATEPLRINRADISNSDKKGKWWLVGASWKGNDTATDTDTTKTEKHDTNRNTSDEIDPDNQEVDFLTLSKQYRMNTSIRRSIFTAIMSATDLHDAQTRLLKLRLSSKQDQEVARVLLRCARAEPIYNPYYALLARNLCRENRKIRMSLQFGLWDFFNRMGERSSTHDDNDDNNSDDDDEDRQDQRIEMHEIVNMSKLFAFLVSGSHLSLSVLKVLDIGPLLKPQTVLFLEVLLVSIMTQSQSSATNKQNVKSEGTGSDPEDKLLKIFGRMATEAPQLIKGMKWFIRRNVRGSDLVDGKKRDKKMLKRGCEVADVAFGVVLANGNGSRMD